MADFTTPLGIFIAVGAIFLFVLFMAAFRLIPMVVNYLVRRAKQ